MSANGLKSGDSVLLLDSIIAAGGTRVAIIKELVSRRIRVEGTVAFIERAELRG